MLHEPEPATASRTILVGLIGVTLIVFTASVASHQLTPTAILVSVMALVVARCVEIQGDGLLLGPTAAVLGRL
jgi:hypothetical protein